MQQQIKEQETQVKVIERMQEIELQEQEIQRKAKNLESQVRQPAEAEKFKLETIAEANKQKAVLEAQAEAEAIQLKGEAKAFAIEAKAKAEAEQMAKKADAWNEYEKAALMDMMLKVCTRNIIYYSKNMIFLGKIADIFNFYHIHSYYRHHPFEKLKTFPLVKKKGPAPFRIYTLITT